jgi:hypothetical protein
MTDWAAWGTTAGTLVLAGATFAAVRSGGRSARVAERTLLVGLRPLLVTSRAQDPPEQVQFADGRTFDVRAGRAMVRQEDGVIYLAIPLRNVGSGIAVLHGYHLEPEAAQRVAQDPWAQRDTKKETVPQTSRSSSSSNVTCMFPRPTEASGKQRYATPIRSCMPP